MEQQKYPTERKVAAASWAATVATFVVGWIVLAVPGLSGLAGPLQALIVAVLTGLAAWVSGWMARHSPRTPSNSSTPYSGGSQVG